jgi:hypothetical protein
MIGMEGDIVNRRMAVSLLMAALALAPSGSLLAHPGHEHKVLGTVTMVGADHVMVKTKDHATAAIYVNRDTKISQDTKAMTLADIKTGMRVAITAVSAKEKDVEKTVAKSIQLGPAPPRP